jgi:hypothetical protein
MQPAVQAPLRTVFGANLCARDTLQLKVKGIRGVTDVADKYAYTVNPLNIIPQRNIL